MKFIFDQRVRVTGEFYIGQSGFTRAYHMVKGKKSEDPNLVDEPDFEGYAVELEKFPGVQIMMKGDLLEDAPLTEQEIKLRELDQMIRAQQNV